MHPLQVLPWVNKKQRREETEGEGNILGAATGGKLGSDMGIAYLGSSICRCSTGWALLISIAFTNAPAGRKPTDEKTHECTDQNAMVILPKHSRKYRREMYQNQLPTFGIGCARGIIPFVEILVHQRCQASHRRRRLSQCQNRWSGDGMTQVDVYTLMSFRRDW
jgi:hypothetical protein